MSVVIKGMDIPVQCVSCPLWSPQVIRSELIDICRVSNKIVDNPYRKPTWCPMIKVEEKK